MTAKRAKPAVTARTAMMKPAVTARTAMMQRTTRSNGSKD